MALQMHLAPRAVQVQGLTGEFIRIDKSILAGCGYSVPFVKALLHEGSLKVAATTASDDYPHDVDGQDELLLPPPLPPPCPTSC